MLPSVSFTIVDVRPLSASSNICSQTMFTPCCRNSSVVAASSSTSKTIALKPVASAAAKALSSMTNARDAIVADPKLAPAVKREKIAALQVQRNDLAKTVMTAPAVRATQ